LKISKTQLPINLQIALYKLTTSHDAHFPEFLAEGSALNKINTTQHQITLTLTALDAQTETLCSLLTTLSQEVEERRRELQRALLKSESGHERQSAAEEEGKRLLAHDQEQERRDAEKRERALISEIQQLEAEHVQTHKELEESYAACHVLEERVREHERAGDKFGKEHARSKAEMQEQINMAKRELGACSVELGVCRVVRAQLDGVEQRALAAENAAEASEEER
jgi:hypothetical protein